MRLDWAHIAASSVSTPGSHLVLSRLLTRAAEKIEQAPGMLVVSDARRMEKRGTWAQRGISLAHGDMNCAVRMHRPELKVEREKSRAHRVHSPRTQ